VPRDVADFQTYLSAKDGAGAKHLQAVDDPNLFAPWFRDPATWTAWRAFLAALVGLPTCGA
jgi:hypothetical protein